MGLSLYKVVFMGLLLFGEALFLVRLERRAHFWPRAVLCALLLLGTAAALPVLGYDAWHGSALFLTLFACTLAGLAVCFAEPFENLLFCGVAGYTVQHLAYLLYTFLNDLTQMGRAFGNVIDPYASDPLVLSELAWLQVAFYADCYFLVYAAAFFIFDPKLQANHDLQLGRTNMVVLSGLLIAADVILNMVTNYYTAPYRVPLLLERCYNILLCGLILALLYYQLAQRQLKDELSGVRFVLEQGKKQYELARKNAELLNIKYHDLRHQRDSAVQAGLLAGEGARELDQVLQQYAAQIKTGNETLDVILTEKARLCADQGIHLSCMADGPGAAFVKPHHLYALLGNAIDNAMEAVLALPAQSRIINLFVRRQGNMLQLHTENPCAAVRFRGGLPVSQKKDQSWHGFGMLSMKTVAEQYGGMLSAQTKDGMFLLDVMLLDPEEG